MRQLSDRELAYLLLRFSLGVFLIVKGQSIVTSSHFSFVKPWESRIGLMIPNSLPLVIIAVVAICLGLCIFTGTKIRALAIPSMLITFIVAGFQPVFILLYFVLVYAHQHI